MTTKSFEENLKDIFDQMVGLAPLAAMREAIMTAHNLALEEAYAKGHTEGAVDLDNRVEEARKDAEEDFRIWIRIIKGNPLYLHNKTVKRVLEELLKYPYDGLSLPDKKEEKK